MIDAMDIDRVRVLYDGREVGILSLTEDGLQAFAYSESWIANGFSISPLSLPLQQRLFIAKPEPLEGVFGVFGDSLPDGWGRLLVDRTLAAQGIDPAAVSSLERLSIVGTSGMGALTFEPVSSLPNTFGQLDLDEIAAACASMLETDFSDDLDALFALGGSSGGARPKILTSVDDEEWIIKFAASMDGPDIGKREYEISQAAVRAGIQIPETKLFPSRRCAGYFGVKRFDRESSSKRLHMLSAGAVLETSHRNLDYDTLMRLTWRTTNDSRDIERLFRLMCFNVFVGNRDDHAKNFSYLYDEERGSWHLSPAYDLTCNPGVYGEHAAMVNGKGKGILNADLEAVGISAGMTPRMCRQIIGEVRLALSDADLLDAEYR